MEKIVLNGVARTLGKKSDTKNLRKSGMVPAIVYGPGLENVNFSIDAKELKKITHSPNAYIVVLNIEGKEYTSIFHQIQYNPISDEAMHVDFLLVTEDKPITIKVPITITGNSEGVKLGGNFVLKQRKLKIQALMADLPDTLTVDITPLGIGQRISACDLQFDNIKIMTPKSEVICTIAATRAAKSDK